MVVNSFRERWAPLNLEIPKQFSRWRARNRSDMLRTWETIWRHGMTNLTYISGSEKKVWIQLRHSRHSLAARLWTVCMGVSQHWDVWHYRNLLSWAWNSDPYLNGCTTSCYLSTQFDPSQLPMVALVNRWMDTSPKRLVIFLNPSVSVKSIHQQRHCRKYSKKHAETIMF